MSSDNKKRIQVTVLKQAPSANQASVQPKRQGKAKSTVLPSVCGGTQTQRGFSAVYDSGEIDAVLPSGVLDTYWHSSPTAEDLYYGSFNDGGFLDTDGFYTVSSDGYYNITANFILAIADDQVLAPPNFGSEIWVQVQPVNGSGNQIIAGAAISETTLQKLALTSGSVTGNTLNKITTISINRNVMLKMGDLVRLVAEMARPWRLRTQSTFGTVANSFSIVKIK